MCVEYLKMINESMQICEQRCKAVQIRPPTRIRETLETKGANF